MNLNMLRLLLNVTPIAETQLKRILMIILCVIYLIILYTCQLLIDFKCVSQSSTDVDGVFCHHHGWLMLRQKDLYFNSVMTRSLEKAFPIKVQLLQPLFH